jgi:Carboxypeptidase regulatory-like domain
MTKHATADTSREIRLKIEDHTVRVFVGFLLCLSAVHCFGQTCTFPSDKHIEGQVFDPTRAAIAKASVVIKGASMHSRTIQTNSAGEFDFKCLSPGHYHLTISASSFASDEREIDVLPEQAKQNLIITLQVPTVSSTVSVADDSTALDSEHGAGAKVLSQKDLAGLASDSDDLQRELQAMATAAGGSPGKAIITVDGFQNASRMPPKSSIREVLLNPDLYSAEYQTPPYEGGRIEIYTKPGQGEFHGSVFFDDSDATFNAGDPLALTAAPAGKRRYGFDLSGPLLSKTSDFSLDLEKRDIDEYATVHATILDDAYQSVPQIENVAAPQRLWIGNARGDWQLGKSNTLVAGYTANVNNETNQGVGGFTLPEAGYDSVVSQYDLHISDTAFLNPKLMNEARIGFSWKNTQQQPLSENPALQISGAFTGGGSTAQVLHNRERDLEFDDDVLANVGPHTLKIGVQLLDGMVHDSDPNTFNGSFIFGGGLAPQLDANNQPIAGPDIAISGLEQYRRTLLNLPGGTPTAYSVTQGTALVPFTQWKIAIYVQDQWKLRPQLSFSMGLRYAAQTAPANLGVWAPRLGMAWSPDKHQQWVIHARIGMFYDPIGITTTLEAYRLDGVRQHSITIYNPSFQNPLSTSGAATSPQTIRRFATSVSPSPSFQAQLGVEHDFPKHWHVQTNVYWSRGWDQLRSRNVNAPLVTEPTTTPWLNPRPITPNLNIFEFQNTGGLAGPVVFVGVDQSSYKRFHLFVGYLFMGLRSNADTPMQFPQSSYSDHGDWAQPSWESTHRVFLTGSLNLPWKVELATFLDSASGLPYDVNSGTDSNGDGVFNDRPSVVSQSGSDVYSTQFGLLNANVVNGNLPRNIGTLPWAIHLDSNLSRSFPVGKKDAVGTSRQALEFNARAANLLNHTNVTSVNTFLGFPLGQPVTADFGRRLELGLRYSF